MNASAVRVLVEAMRADVEALVPALEALLFPAGVPAHVDLAAVLGAFGDLLERDLAELTACKELLGAEAGEAEHERDAAVASLRAALLRVRSLLTASFGPGAVSRCGLSSPVPEAPDRLLVYARGAAQALVQAAPEYAQPAPFATLDLGGAAAFLRQHIEALDAAMGATDAHRRKQLELRHERQADELEHHLHAVAGLIDALAWLLHRDQRRARKRSVTEELPALADASARRGA